jgi:hypothetical protein
LNDKKEALLEKELILEEVSSLANKLRGQVRGGERREAEAMRREEGGAKAWLQTQGRVTKELAWVTFTVLAASTCDVSMCFFKC